MRSRVSLLPSRMLRAVRKPASQFSELPIDVNRGVFGIITMLRNFASEEDGFLFLAESQRPEFAHAQSHTIFRAMSVARSMSFPAPV